MIEMREANLNDIDTIITLGKTTFIESHSKYIQNEDAVNSFCDSAFSTEKITNDLSDKNNLFWIIFYDNKPVGFAKVELNTSNDFINEKRVCKLDKIYILNDYLGKKLGKQLHTEIINKITKLQYGCIWLVTYIYNYTAITFYEANNYNKIGFYDFIVAGKGYKNHVLVKKLTL